MPWPALEFRLRPCAWCSAAVAGQHRTGQGRTDSETETALHRRNTTRRRRRRCRCSRCVVEVQTQVKVTGGARPSSACTWLSAAASPSATIYLITVQACIVLPSQHNERPPSDPTQPYSPFTAYTYVTGSQLHSVRKRKRKRKHQPQPPAELCSAAAGTVQRPA